MNKDQVIDGILGREGGYVDNPDDAGGPTRWGVTQKTARANGYTGDMRNLSRDKAREILEQDYWYGPRFDQIATVSTVIANELCDTGVNMGPAFQNKLLQRWLSAFNQNGKL
ncbi:glycoside hydrolase family 108 protein, partial [Yersinia enterocolitica]